ncbi:MAG: HEAT repeat domain-containing protein [Pirellulales bacterium]|nr:HEAT repeat domain-containing protein [Pirellulales bacterium]
MSTVDSLIAALASPDPNERAAAAERLAMLGPEAASAAVVLVRACADTSTEVRKWAAVALSSLGTPRVAHVIPLAGLLMDDNAWVGYWAATLLGRIGAAPAVPALAAAVNSGPIEVRCQAAWALGQIGESARAALRVLLQATASDDVRLVARARDAIERING